MEKAHHNHQKSHQNHKSSPNSHGPPPRKRARFVNFSFFLWRFSFHVLIVNIKGWSQKKRLFLALQSRENLSNKLQLFKNWRKNPSLLVFIPLFPFLKLPLILSKQILQKTKARNGSPKISQTVVQLSFFLSFFPFLTLKGGSSFFFFQ